MNRVIFETAKKGDYAELRSLWEECFPEFPDFNRFYFKNMYSPDRARVIRIGGSIAAALYVFEYEFAVTEGEIMTAYYLYGIGTKSEMRGNGIASELIAETLKEARKKGTDVCMLVPQSKSLFSFYEKLGFIPGFGLSKKVHHFSGFDCSRVRKAKTEDIPEMDNLYETVFAGKVHVMRNEREWELLFCEADKGNGDFYILEEEGKVEAYCLLVRDGDELTVAETVFRKEEQKKFLLDGVARGEGVKTLAYCTAGDDEPYGMLMPLSSRNPDVWKNPMNPYMNLMHS